MHRASVIFRSFLFVRDWGLDFESSVVSLFFFRANSDGRSLLQLRPLNATFSNVAGFHASSGVHKWIVETRLVVVQASL